MIKNITLPDERYFEEAGELHNRERVNPLTNTNTFRAGVYCILSPREIYQKIITICCKLFIQKGLGEPQKIIDNPSTLEQVLKTTMKKRTKRVQDFAHWWLEHNFYQEILADLNNNRKDEVNLRDKLATGKDKAPGMGLKCASLLFNMLGYAQVAPIDVWVLRYFGVEAPSSGISNKTYREYEIHLQNLAQEAEVKPAILHKAIWCRDSTWNRQNLDQLSLFPPLIELHDIYEK